MATPTTSGDEIMNLLLGENEELEEVLGMVEAVLTMDDITVDVEQYAIHDPLVNDEGEAMPESFEFLGSQGPTLSRTIEVQEDEEEEETLSEADAPKQYIAFEVGTVDPLAEVAEPVHTGKGGLYSPVVATTNDDDLLGVVGPIQTGMTPDLPDLPDDEPLPTTSLAQASHEPIQQPRYIESQMRNEKQTTSPPADIPRPPSLDDIDDMLEMGDSPPSPNPSVNIMQTPDLPDFDDDWGEPSAKEKAPTPMSSAEESERETTPSQQTGELENNRFWPWPKGEAWSPTQVYKEVVAAMEHIQHGRVEQAAQTLDALGPHLDDHLDMLLHICVLMQHLGRHEHVKWMLDMAAYVHPENAHVQHARAQLLA